MCTKCSPTSVREYCTNKAVRTAVDALIEKLDGSDPPEVKWEEARKYNQALLMAAQVRGDFVDFLFEVWNGSFGKAEPDRLRGEYLDCESCSPAVLWEKGELARYYYRNGNPDDDGPWDELGVSVDEVGDISLSVSRCNNEESYYTLAEDMDLPDGWKIESNEYGKFLVNESVNMKDLDHGDTCPIKRFADDARRAVEFLVENPPG